MTVTRLFFIVMFVTLSPVVSDAGFLCDNQCMTCTTPSASEKLIMESCKIEMKQSDCDDWFEKYPNAKLSARNCETLSTCSVPRKVSEYVLTCFQGLGDSEINLSKGIFDFLFGSFLKHCRLIFRKEKNIFLNTRALKTNMTCSALTLVFSLKNKSKVIQMIKIMIPTMKLIKFI